MVFLRFYLKGCMLTKTYPGDILTYILKYNLEESMFYRFPAMRGIQANSEYFVCMIPLGVLSKIFIEDSSDVLPEFRAQRKLKEQRIPEIRDYIINNRDSYVFSALAASVDGEVTFFPTRESGNIGELEVDMTATFLINDGQHRKAAIIEAIEFDESLKDETIALVLYAFGKLGAYFFSHPQYDIHKYLTGLSKIDWSRSNLECWENRAITDKGRINRNEKGIFLTYIQIKRLLNLEIDSEEAAREKQLL